ncbi:MAG: hypothetical protein NT029_18550 [Armatimonadetes bacterium]|nr:hypothetical protein [Armatimonadota bacterium]
MAFKPALAVVLAAVCLSLGAAGQTNRNVSNRRFATVASGPMYVQVIEAGRGASPATFRTMVAETVNRARRARAAGAARYLSAVYGGRLRGQRPFPGIPDVVFVRQDGKVLSPAPSSRGASGLTLSFPATGTSGSWPAALQIDLQAAFGVIYPQLVAIYGEPSWSGTLTLIDGDSLPAGQIITDPNALSGGVYNASTGEVTLAQYNSAQSMLLSMTQMLALAFRGTHGVAYDAWERGMARAATVATLSAALPALKTVVSQAYGGTLGDLAPSDPLWSSLDRYDLLNQPALGNDRFFPVSKEASVANEVGFPTMLIPRLQMSGSAWLKVWTEAPGFFSAFNRAYYAVLAGDPGAGNSIPKLVAVASQALSSVGAPTVEGLPFTDWYQRQYVLDTSVSAGSKLYTMVSNLRPDTDTADDYGVGCVFSHYTTTFDAHGNSDEVDKAGTVYPIYSDYTTTTRFFLGAQYERADIQNGMGSVAPTFFNTVGGDPAFAGRMRIVMDFPVNGLDSRLAMAPRSMGTLVAPRNFWGVVVGADTGTVRLEADGLNSGEVPVAQGAFGAAVDEAFFSRPRRATVTFTGASGSPVVRRVNTGYGEAVMVFTVGTEYGSRVHTLPSGLTMLSVPVRPLPARPVDALLDPTTSLPLFTEGSLLMAQWDQSATGDDKYRRSPSLGPLEPGKGYWMSWAGGGDVKIVGRTTAIEPEVTVQLRHGWNQIGNPFETTAPVSTLRFQYLADNVPVSLATAVTNGWIVAQTLPTVGQVVVFGFDSQLGYVAAQNLEPWRGYWIRVMVSEGVTMSVTNPSPGSARAARVVAEAPTTPAGWAVRLSAVSSDGAGASATFGQALTGHSGYDATLDALAPPPPAASTPAVLFVHADWAGQSGRYWSDIRALGQTTAWQCEASGLSPNTAYRFTWSSLAAVPRSVHLTAVDEATGRRIDLRASGGLAFTTGSETMRKLRVEASASSQSALRLTALQAVSSRAAGGLVRVAFDVTSAASVSAEIRSAAGAPVRTVSTGRAVPAGTQSLLWDGRDDRGISVPAGSYLMTVTARNDLGETARAVAPVVVVR